MDVGGEAPAGKNLTKQNWVHCTKFMRAEALRKKGFPLLKGFYNKYGFFTDNKKRV